ncbi:MAG: universal stress protein [Chloroflexi bacterium]|nr:universal stress protein [Chloroflexota bacterium]
MDVVLARASKTEGVYPFVGTRGLEVAIEKEGVTYLENIGEELENKGLNVSWELLRGAPASALVDYAQKMPQDMIVMTTHGRTGFRRLLLGSVAEALVRSSGDPVLLIPAKEEGG